MAGELERITYRFPSWADSIWPQAMAWLPADVIGTAPLAGTEEVLATTALLSSSFSSFSRRPSAEKIPVNGNFGSLGSRSYRSPEISMLPSGKTAKEYGIHPNPG